MPRFFFDRAHAHSYRDDPIGAEFESVEAALQSATETAMELAASLSRAGLSLDGQSIIVRDVTGAKVGEVNLAQVSGDLH